MDNVKKSQKLSNIKNNELVNRKCEISKEKHQQIIKMLEVQESFRQFNIMCDVILLADDGKKIPAHKVILASSSQFFLSMFNANFKEKNEQIVLIKEIDSDILEIIVKYIYTFKLDMTEENIERLLKTLHFFALENVMDTCYDFIKNILNLDNCISFMKYAKLFSYDRLYNLSFAYALQKFFNIKDSILYQLSYEEIKTFISNDFLVTQSEEQVFKFICNWVKFDEKNRKIYLPEIMKHVKLASKTFLVEVLDEPLFRIDKIKDLFANLIDPGHYTNNNGLNRRGKKIILQSLNKPDVIVAIDNVHDHGNVYCNNISSDLSVWTPGPRFFLPPNKGSTIIALEIGLLFSIGGTTQSHISTNNVYFLNFQNWLKATSMLYSRQNFGVCSTEGYLYVIGGTDADGNTLNTVEIYDISTDKWSLLCTMMESRSHCYVIYYNKCLYIIGGTGIGGKPLSSIECYNISTSTWNNNIDTLPKLCTYVSCAVVIQNELYIFGDCCNKNFITVFKYGLQDGRTWSLLLLLDRRYDANVAVVNEQLYIFGGVDRDRNPVDSVEIYDFKKNVLSVYPSKFNGICQNIITVNKQLMIKTLEQI